MMTSELKREMVEVCRALYQRQLLAAMDGNLSVRVDGDNLLTTPSGINKGFIREEDILRVDFSGQVLKGEVNPPPNCCSTWRSTKCGRTRER